MQKSAVSFSGSNEKKKNKPTDIELWTKSYPETFKSKQKRAL